MRFKSLIVGIVFLTVFTCSYAPTGYSFSFEDSPKIELILSKTSKEVVSKQELRERSERSSISFNYSFSLKQPYHLPSSPPRASP